MYIKPDKSNWNFVDNSCNFPNKHVCAWKIATHPRIPKTLVWFDVIQPGYMYLYLLVIQSVGSHQPAVARCVSVQRLQVNPANTGRKNNRIIGYERVYLPLWQVTYTPFHIQGEVMLIRIMLSQRRNIQPTVVQCAVCVGIDLDTEHGLPAKLINRLM